MRGHCPFCFIYTIANHISKSLAIPVTDTTFFQRYCIKCKEDRKENVRNKIVLTPYNIGHNMQNLKCKG